MLNNLGDGSTLSLDFTAMGDTLDSRFTFSRSSNATFINSSGYVQYANHNLVRNSTFSSLTGWAPTGTGTTTNADGVLTLSTSAAQTQLYYSQTNANLFQDNAPVSGRVYSASINITAVSGGITYAELITIGGSISSVTRYKDGVLVSDNATAATGLITIVWTSGGGNTLRIGISASGTTSFPSASVSMTLPRCVIGSQTQPTYIESPVASTYHAPRFDYDPTTLTPRGLLIEGSATNLVTNSDTLPTGTSWAANSVTRTNVSTLTPDGNTTTTTCGISHTGSGSFRSFAVTVLASTAYTFSFWVKNNGGSVALYRAYNVSGSADIVSETSYFSQINSSTWTRIQFTFTTPSGCTSIYVYPLSQSSGTSNILVWGAQLEAGGASSYIPTGASTVQRAADICEMTGTNFSSWYNASPQTGTVLLDITNSTLANTNGGFELSSGTGSQGTSNRVSFRRDATIVGGTTLNLTPTGGGQRFKTATAFALNDIAAVRNGGSAVTSTSQPNSMSGINAMKFYVDAAAGGLNTYGWVRQLKVWPTRLPNATLQSLTT
jgi:hypothetical protein